MAHKAFAAAADPVLDQAPSPVAHLGIDEHRRGRPRWRTDADTGEYELLADRWHTCFFDLSGEQGLLGQVEGRTADDAAYWLATAAPAWRDAVRVVAIDMCSIYACAVRRMLPGAQIAVDLFHVVHLAVKMTGDVRRRVVRGKYGRRGRSGDPGYGIKNLLVRNLECNGERNRCMHILKSRGMAHSNQIREFLLTDRGIELLDVYVGPEGVLTGSMRVAQAAASGLSASRTSADLSISQVVTAMLDA